MGKHERDSQTVTIRLSRDVLSKAKALAARRRISISELLAEQLELLMGSEEDYDRAERQARLLLERGFHMGGAIAGRDELHDR